MFHFSYAIICITVIDNDLLSPEVNTMEQYFLLPLAVIPPILFMLLIYWMDRHQPESMKHVLIALILGAASTLPSLIVQLAFGFVPLFTLPGVTGSFFESFILVAPSEEFFKFIVIYLFVRKKAFYNEINDGIVYYGTGAIGFALLENILYVFGNGVGTGLMRAFTSIPLHTFCGVIVGYHAGLARFGNAKHPRLIMLRGILIAVFTHALYNTLASSDSLLILLFFVLLVVVYISGFLVLRKGRILSLNGFSQPVPQAVPLTVPGPIPGAPVIPAYGTAMIMTDEFGRRYMKARKETWKAVLGRLILGVCILLWLLILWAGSDMQTSLADLIFGTFILTFIPAAIGIVLEISFQRSKKKRIYIY